MLTTQGDLLWRDFYKDLVIGSLDIDVTNLILHHNQ